MSALNKRIGTADRSGTVVEVSYSPTDENGDGAIFLTLINGDWRVPTLPTPTAARQIAGALIDAADKYDEDEREFPE